MKKNEIQIGGHYQAKVSGKLTTVRVDDIRENGNGTRYDVTNLATNRRTTFRSAQKFRCQKRPAPTKNQVKHVDSPLSNALKPRNTNTAPHIIVKALAGTGKTTTLVEGLKRIKGIPSSIEPSPQQAAVWESMSLSSEARSICFVAFNKSIATELAERVPDGCDAMTMHSMGYKAVTKAFGRKQPNGWVVTDHIGEILEKDPREIRKTRPNLLNATEKLVGLCKMNLVGYDFDSGAFDPSMVTSSEIGRLTVHYDVDLNGDATDVYDLVPAVLEKCLDVGNSGRITFDDMIWLPVVLNLPLTRYDLLLVDECQDLNRCQQALAKRAGDRLVLCGDEHQAIYGFAGADAEAMDRMEQELRDTEVGCDVLPLTVTRRCGKAVVDEARWIVPQFEAHESNGDGMVRRMRYEGEATSEADPTVYHDSVQDGDMVLCRVNAPLVSQCFRFLKAGRKATVQGRDVGQGLISTVKKLKASDVADLQCKLSDWQHKEIEKENRKWNPNEQRLIAIQDRYDCLCCFIEDQTTVDGVIARIESVFTDQKYNPGIRLSSIHKAKGLEADRVFFLMPKGGECPHPMARSAWQQEQEMNLKYVGITRAIKELVYVS